MPEVVFTPGVSLIPTTATVSLTVLLNITLRAAGTASTEPLNETEPFVPLFDELLRVPPKDTLSPLYDIFSPEVIPPLLSRPPLIP